MIHKSAASLLEASHRCFIVFFPPLSGRIKNYGVTGAPEPPQSNIIKQKKEGVLLGRGLLGGRAPWVKGHRVGKPLNSNIVVAFNPAAVSHKLRRANTS